MIRLMSALVALALACLAMPVGARAQGCGSLNPNCIVPTAPLGTSNNQAASTAFVQSAIAHAAGGTNGQIQYNNSGALGGFTASGDATIATPSGVITIQPNAVTSGKIAANAVTNAKINPGAANTMKASLDGAATSDVALTACSLTYQITKWVSGSGWQCGVNPVLPSRTTASGVDLSSFTGIQTLGYSAAGDGGGARFSKRSTAVQTYTKTLNGSCNNGTWPQVQFSGGTGTGVYGTVVVAGGVATSITITGAYSQGNGYSANDVLTAQAGNITCVTYPQITVNTVGNAPFRDSTVLTTTTSNAGVGCTPGTYYGVLTTGGVGGYFQANVVIGGGGTVTGTPTITNGGGGYKVGDVLTTSGITGCGTAPTLTVATISTPRASFTDSAGNAWQYVPDPTGINVLQFGAVADFVMQLQTYATDNGAAFRAALNYAGSGIPYSDASGYDGTSVWVPQGGYLVCGGITVYENTRLRGVSTGGSVLQQCNSDSAGTNFITLGDPLRRLGSFFAEVWDLTAYGGFNSGTAYVIYSNSSQSGDLISRVAIYGVSRGCIKYEIAYGGQSMGGIHSILCVANATYFTSGAAAVALDGNAGFNVDGQSLIIGASTIAKGLSISSGGLNTQGLHCEGPTNCIYIDGSGGSPPLVTVQNGIGGSSITNYIYLVTGTPANNLSLLVFNGGGVTPCTVYSQATASCAKTGNQQGLGTY